VSQARPGSSFVISSLNGHWRLGLEHWLQTANCRLAIAAKRGTRGLKSQVALETAAEVSLQIGPQVSLQAAMRIGQKVGRPIAAGNQPQVTFRKDPAIAMQTGRRIAEKAPPPTPARAPVRIAP
jgi:hypothetical protein